MKRQYPIQIYTIYKNQIPKMSFVQHDTEVNRIYFELFEDINVTMTDIVTATLSVKRFDGNTYTYGMSENERPVFIIEGNLVTVILPPSAVYSAGECSASVSLYDSNMGRLTTQTFKYTVTPELMSDTPIDETNEYPILIKLIEDTTILKDAYQGAIEGNLESLNYAEIANSRKGEADLGTKIGKIDSQLKDNVINILYPPVPLLPAIGTKTEVTAAINIIADYCRLNNKDMHIPSATFLINGTLDFSNLTVSGDGENSKIQMDSTQVDVIKATSRTTLKDFNIHGGWDGTTAGQLGSGIYAGNASGAWIGNIQLSNMVIEYCKKNGIFLQRLGYSSLNDLRVRACGLNSLELFGNIGGDAVTTISVKASTLGSCPNGYGVKVTNGVSITLDNCILEESKGIELAGNENRNINIIGCHEETISSGKFVTFTGAGMNINIIGCYCGDTAIDYNGNFYGVNILTCTSLTYPSVDTTNWNMVQRSEELTLSKAKILSSLTVCQGFESWQYGHMIFCGQHMWVDAQGRLRIKATAPTSDGDGTVVGTQA